MRGRHASISALVLALAATGARAMEPVPDPDPAAGRMQGGDALPDARDPHAWSGGYRRGAGAHALPHGQGLDHGMDMSGARSYGALLVDRLERAAGTTAYDTRAAFGTSYDKLVFKAEGEAARGRLAHNRAELLWSHAVAPFWDAQLGLRHDGGSGLPGRGWLALGLQGLAPYWFELEATAYLGPDGRTALRLAGEYELLITQRWILQPRAEAAWQGRRDPATHTGSGFTGASAGLRLRYEFSRQFAPYIGVERAGSFGGTADLARALGTPPRQTRWVAGLRFWF